MKTESISVQDRFLIIDSDSDFTVRFNATKQIKYYRGRYILDLYAKLGVGTSNADILANLYIDYPDSAVITWQTTDIPMTELSGVNGQQVQITGIPVVSVNPDVSVVVDTESGIWRVCAVPDRFGVIRKSVSTGNSILFTSLELAGSPYNFVPALDYQITGIGIKSSVAQVTPQLTIYGNPSSVIYLPNLVANVGQNILLAPLNLTMPVTPDSSNIITLNFPSVGTVDLQLFYTARNIFSQV